MLDKNICIIGLSQPLINKISKLLADKLDMFYANINDLLSYEIIDIDYAKKVNGIEYIDKIETRKIKTVASYVNTLINLNFSTLVKHENYKCIKGVVKIIYLKQDQAGYVSDLKKNNLSESQIKIAKTLFAERDKFCQEMADATCLLTDNDANKTISDLQKLILK